MFTKILVPLDGSSLSERALPIAASIAQSANASLLLVRAVWTRNMPPGLDNGETYLSAVQEAEAYLEAVARRLGAGVQVQVVQFDRATEPVGVDVDQSRPTGQRRVHPGDDEGRRTDPPGDTESGGDAARQGRLAGAERAVQDHQVTGAQAGCQSASERFGIGRGRQPQHGAALFGAVLLGVARLLGVVRLVHPA